MKIYSWNLRWRNTRISDVFTYIQKLDFDVMCLQEVSENLFNQLRTLPCEMAFALDSARRYGEDGPEKIFTVILTRYRIFYSEAVTFPRSPMPLRTKIFILGMRPFGWARIEERGSLFADIETPEGKVRIFSIHLTLAGPTFRQKELAVIDKHLTEEIQTILCGDFNIVEHKFIKLISWILGSPFSESLPNHDERLSFEEWIKDRKLKNPLRGKVTHPFSNSQLDHILVPTAATVSVSSVEADLVGSDHSPIFVECKIR